MDHKFGVPPRGQLRLSRRAFHFTASTDREDWRRCVVQCVFDTRWTKAQMHHNRKSTYMMISN